MNENFYSDFEHKKNWKERLFWWFMLISFCAGAAWPNAWKADYPWNHPTAAELYIQRATQEIIKKESPHPHPTFKEMDEQREKDAIANHIFPEEKP